MSDQTENEKEKRNSGSACKDHQKNEQAISGVLSSYLGPASVIAVVSAISYIIAYIYYVSYSDTLGVPYRSISLPPITFYLSLAGVFYVFPFLILILSILYIQKNPIKERIVPWLIVSSVYILIFILRFNEIIISSTHISPLYLILFYILPLAVLTFYFIFSCCFPNAFLKMSISARRYIGLDIFFIFFIIPILISLAIYAGNNEANRLVHNQSDSLEIKFDLQNNSLLPEDWFILVMYRDNKYFVIDKNYSAFKSNGMYVIPEKEVKKATIKRNSNT